MNSTTARHPADIVVCVHNSPEDVKLCLSTARDTLRTDDQLIIIDDGSADETRLICEEIAASAPDSVKLIRRATGSGFCKAANAGIRETTAETVIILNSDTIVVGDWIDRIVNCMCANWQIGIVGPLSNAGGWQSIPKLPTREAPSNVMHDDLSTVSDVHAYCSGFGDRFDYPIVEQINGFCFALSRAVIDTVGLFDEARFPMGYGEENDLTFRALDAGFLCSVAIDCFVYHAKTKSYSTETREKYSEAGQAHLHELYTMDRVRGSVKTTYNHVTLSAIRADAEATFAKNDWLENS